MLQCALVLDYDGVHVFVCIRLQREKRPGVIKSGVYPTRSTVSDALRVKRIDDPPTTRGMKPERTI